MSGKNLKNFKFFTKSKMDLFCLFLYCNELNVCYCNSYLWCKIG